MEKLSHNNCSDTESIEALNKKSRTISGQDCEFNFRESRNFFSPERVEEHCEKSEHSIKVVNSADGLNETSQGEQSVKASQGKTTRLPKVKISEPEKNKHRQKTRKRTLRSPSSIVKTVKRRQSARHVTDVSSAKNNNSEYYTDSESECYQTPPATPLRSVKITPKKIKQKGPKQSAWQIGVSKFFKKHNNMSDSEVVNMDCNEPNTVNGDEGARSEKTTEAVVSTTEKEIFAELQSNATTIDKMQNEDPPKVIDLKTVMNMFKRLQKSKVEDKKAAATSVDKDWKEKVDKFIQDSSSKIDEKQSVSNSEIIAEVNWLRRKEKIASRTIQRLYDINMELSTRLDNLEINNAKRCFTITGLNIEAKKDEAINIIESFVLQELGLTIRVEDTYEIVRGPPSSTRVVVLQSQKEKYEVLKAKQLLKGLLNDYEVPFYINDFHPVSQNEKRKYENSVHELNQELPKDDQKNISFRGGNLYIDETLKPPRVYPPQPEDILDVPDDQLQRILDTKLSPGPKIEQSNSEFKAYCISISDHDEIQDAYCKMRWVHAAARHIVCAYIIPNQEFHETKGHCDDGEFGAGRKILDMMKENNIENRAIFVVRYYGGVKMGSDRFDCYLQAAKGVIQQNPTNSVLNKDQIIEKKDEQSSDQRQQTQQKTTQSRYVRGRGRSANHYRPKNYINKPAYRSSYNPAYQPSNSERRHSFSYSAAVRGSGGTYRSQYSVRGAKPASTKYQGTSNKRPRYSSSQEGSPPHIPHRLRETRSNEAQPAWSEGTDRDWQQD